MPFILPMLAARLEDPRRLADLRSSTEPNWTGSALNCTSARITPSTPSAVLVAS